MGSALTVRDGNLTNAALAAGVQIGSRQEKFTVESGRSNGFGVAAGLGDGIALGAETLGDGLALAAEALGDGLGSTAD